MFPFFLLFRQRSGKLFRRHFGDVLAFFGGLDWYIARMNHRNAAETSGERHTNFAGLVAFMTRLGCWSMGFWWWAVGWGWGVVGRGWWVVDGVMDRWLWVVDCRMWALGGGLWSVGGGVGAVGGGLWAMGGGLWAVVGWFGLMRCAVWVVGCGAVGDGLWAVSGL